MATWRSSSGNSLTGAESSRIADVSPEDYKALTENPFCWVRPVPCFTVRPVRIVNIHRRLCQLGTGRGIYDLPLTAGTSMKYLAQIQWDTVFDCAEGTLYVEFCRTARSYPCSISRPERRLCHEFAKA